MPANLLPNLGLLNGWERGEDFWGGPMNDNLAALDAVVQLTIKSLSLNAPPPEAAEGFVYGVGSNPVGLWAGQNGKVALLLNGAWRFYDPKPGWRARVESLGRFMWYNGTAWVDETTGFDPEDPNPPENPTFFDLSVTVIDAPVADQVIVHMPLISSVMLPGNMAGSILDMITPIQSAAGLRVFRNGSQVGAIDVPSGAYNANMATPGGNGVTFSVGDRLTIRGPALEVPQFKNFGFTLRFLVV